MKLKILLTSLLFIKIILYAHGQISDSEKGVLSISENLTITIRNNSDQTKSKPLFSYRWGDPSFQNMKRVTSDKSPASIRINWASEEYNFGTKGLITLTNVSTDTMAIDNFVPFGEDPSHIYITGKGRHHLSRTHLFRPGYSPVNVIVPDNLWNLGFSCGEISPGHLQAALIRRKDVENGSKRRFETILYPGGTVSLEFYSEQYEGDWQNGLRKVFQDRKLYDVLAFDNTLYEREDLHWIRNSYVMHLIMTWDKVLYDRGKEKYTLTDFLEEGKKWYGWNDVVGIWPTWPSLGLDQRNQWDLFRDMPGGMEALNNLAKESRDSGTRFFISYNPWDQSTRHENHYEGMSELIGKIGVDGVVLDTQGSSSKELQNAADSKRKGVVMYSEGMAIPKDMQGIVSGRVHNALYYPPLLNLNKLIKPDFAIFRVAELQHERIRREYATSFFNGYGTELNIFRPGRPHWVEEDYKFFGKTAMILRENTNNFTSNDLVPLLSTRADSIYVNQWNQGKKTVYTIFSLIPEGYEGPLFTIPQDSNFHYIDLWNHQEAVIKNVDGNNYVNVNLDGFSKKWLGTNNEGAVGAIAKLPIKIQLKRTRPGLWHITCPPGGELRIWAGLPGYEKNPHILGKSGDYLIDLQNLFGDYRGKYIVQLFEEEELTDEKIIRIPPGTALLASSVIPTHKNNKPKKDMVRIPSGKFTWKISYGDNFIPTPEVLRKDEFEVKSFYMDKFPVTNAQFQKFLKSSGYIPADTTNFLKHWDKGKPTKEILNKPVVFISLEDARAYAKWAGKRLPTESEWQYAAQTPALNPWPWGKMENTEESSQYVTNTLTVKKISGIDSTLCNPGNGIPDDVGSYPAGENPYGLQDLVGSVWQLTQDVYHNDSYQFVILKGGSYFHPGSSWWYVQGGPRELTYREKLLMVSPGFERNETVGFRCVMDMAN